RGCLRGSRRGIGSNRARARGPGSWGVILAQSQSIGFVRSPAYIPEPVDGETSRTIDSWGALLVRSRDGDELAFEELVKACERRVVTIAYQITGNLHDAQDVAQESFLRVYRSRDRFQDGRSFEAWLYRIVVNQARKSLARARRHRVDPLDERGAEASVEGGRSVGGGCGGRPGRGRRFRERLGRHDGAARRAFAPPSLGLRSPRSPGDGDGRGLPDPGLRRGHRPPALGRGADPSPPPAR